MRRMEINDITKVINLELKIFNESLGINLLHNELTINPFAHYFVIEDNNNIIGYIGIRAYDENAEILNFLIDTNYQKLGYGSKLLNEALASLKDIKTISLEVRSSNTNAINFYLKHGFTYSHTRSNYYGNEDALVYIKEVL